jgi:hypothetical protein
MGGTQVTSALGGFDELAFQQVALGLNQRVNQNAAEYWNRIRGNRRIPLRQDFDPTDIPRVLPSIIMLEVVRPELDFRYRLMGTRWVDHFGRNDTGRLMSDLEHQRPPSKVWSAAEKVTREAMPLAPDLPYVGKLFGNREIEVLMSPLSREGDMVDFLLVTVDFNR